MLRFALRSGRQPFFRSRKIKAVERIKYLNIIFPKEAVPEVFKLCTVLTSETRFVNALQTIAKWLTFKNVSQMNDMGRLEPDAIRRQAAKCQHTRFGAKTQTALAAYDQHKQQQQHPNQAPMATADGEI